MSFRRIEGGITTPRGFRAAAARAGLRSGPGPDLALVVSESGPIPAAATFTRNRLRAAPVEVAMRSLRASRGRVAAVIANAGCANAGTGREGIADAEATQRLVAECIGVSERHIFTASTGLIGSRLDVARIASVLPGLHPAVGREADAAAARAIMTTDTVAKEAAAEVRLDGGRTVRIGGMAKGSGMIHPTMGTMLAFLTTDAPIGPRLLREALRTTVDRTFNQVTVDGDPSTNDTVLLMASGAARGHAIEDGADLHAFTDGLEAVCRAMAEQIAADGEGAERRIDVAVSGAHSDREARVVARAVAASNLVKAAVHGGDPNWGRIAAAAGRSGARFDPDRLRVRIGQVAVYDGAPLDYDERVASDLLRGKVVELGLELGLGTGVGMAWGCDLTAEYVAINSEYRT